MTNLHETKRLLNPGNWTRELPSARLNALESDRKINIEETKEPENQK